MHLATRACLSIIVSLLLTACTPALQVAPAETFEPKAAVMGAEQVDRYWWQLRFRLVWPEGAAPDFSQHLLIAEQVLLPVIIENQSQMPLWRFHRRAGRGDSGNQFSLIFYANKATATRINEEVQTAALTQWLLDQNMIDKVRFAQRSPEELGRLELTSDPEWPMDIQRSWPYFIMGASQTWIMLVQELSQADAVAGEVSYSALLEHYKTVDSRLNQQWQQYGQHAYLHHLSAIFGYQPLQIRSSTLRTF
jgi:hypothetical protein